MANERNYYLGIDLGTTNSVLAWGTLDPKTSQIDPKVVEIKMTAAGGGITKKELFPSFVYFKEGIDPIVGEYAKSMIGRQTERVVKSVKSYMGNHKKKWGFDKKQYRPEDVSSLILTHIRRAAKDLFGFIPDDAVITVPASFDTDMRAATIKAAEIAGFRTTEEDGSPRNILLAEPRASLYDFINRQNRGQIPGSLIDFREPKTILVFDLGGGTLDVSLHKVSQSERGIEIEDYAISRYTRIGGDDFDKLLADHFLEHFKKRVNIDTLDGFRRNLLEAQFIEFAELAKIELTQNIENAKLIRGESGNFDAISAEIIKGNVLDDRIFEYDLSKLEYDQVIAPLLGKDLSLSDVDRFKDIDYSRSNNIIYPLLDVLDKARDKIGMPPEIDAILLNGGMTRVHTIQERLREFFGEVQLITAGDPDKSVARGAVVYHYDLHRGIRPSLILNESIGIEIVGGFVEHLARAGTVLPYRSPIYDKFIVPSNGTMFIDLPFYRGNREDTNLPNVQICSRRVEFDRPLKKGEPVSIQIYIDERNIMNVEGWLGTDQDKKFKVSVVTAVEIKPSEKEKPKEYIPLSPPLDINTTLEHLKKQFERYNKAVSDWDKRRLMEDIKSVEGNIKKAENGKEFLFPLIKLINHTNNFGKGRLLITLGELAIRYRNLEAIPKICEKCMDIAGIGAKPPPIINTVVRYAVETIGKTELSMAESHLINLLYDRGSKSIRSSIIHSLGKIARTENTVSQLKSFLKSLEDSDRISTNWAMGRMGSREKGNPIPIKAFSGIIYILCDRIKTETHLDAKRNAIYALGEIGDRRFNKPGNIITDNEADKIIRVLEPLTKEKPMVVKGFKELAEVSSASNQTIINFAQMAINMIKGEALSEQEEKQLLAIRTLIGT